MKKAEDPKVKCAKLCYAEVSKCAKQIEKALAKCGVKLSGDYDDPAGVIIYNILNVGIPEEETTVSSYMPSKDDIKFLANDFRKIYTHKKK